MHWNSIEISSSEDPVNVEALLLLQLHLQMCGVNGDWMSGVGVGQNIQSLAVDLGFTLSWSIPPLFRTQ